MASSFACTNCNAQYKVVQVEGTPTSDNRELTCVSCDAPLPAYEVGLALKYFLVGPKQRRNVVKLAKGN